MEEELYLQPYAWTERPAPRKTDYDEQRAWCLDRQNQPYLVRITDMPCRAFLEFAPAVMNDRVLLRAIVDGLRWRMAPDNPDTGKKDMEIGKAILMGFRVVHDAKFFYESRPGSAIELTVTNREALQVAVNAGKKGMKLPSIARPVFFKVWEAEITTAEKLRTQQRLMPSQWFTGQFRAVEPTRQVSILEREFVAPAASLHGVTQKGADDFWSSHPKLFSVDIECYSSNYRRMPVREAATDVITMISVISQREGDMSTARRFILVDDQDKARLVYALEEQGRIIEDVDVRCYPNEGALLDGFLELLRAEDPEVIVGYNTTGFDIPYIDHRLGKKLKTWGLTSRIKGQVPYVKDRPSESQVFYELHHMEGRIHIDVRDVIRREYKLRSYTLGYVSMEKLGETKHDVKPKEMFEIYDRLRAAKTEEETQTAVVDTMRVAAYCVQDSMLVLKLFEKLNMWLIVVETSNIVFCTPEQVFSRGQQMKCRAQIYDEAHTQGFIIDNQGDAHDYKGAYVQEPDTGLANNIVVLDFTSLYPSIMIFYFPPLVLHLLLVPGPALLRGDGHLVHELLVELMVKDILLGVAVEVTGAQDGRVADVVEDHDARVQRREIQHHHVVLQARVGLLHVGALVVVGVALVVDDETLRVRLVVGLRPTLHLLTAREDLLRRAKDDIARLDDDQPHVQLLEQLQHQHRVLHTVCGHTHRLDHGRLRLCIRLGGAQPVVDLEHLPGLHVVLRLAELLHGHVPQRIAAQLVLAPNHVAHIDVDAALHLGQLVEDLLSVGLRVGRPILHIGHLPLDPRRQPPRLELLPEPVIDVRDIETRRVVAHEHLGILGPKQLQKPVQQGALVRIAAHVHILHDRAPLLQGVHQPCLVLVIDQDEPPRRAHVALTLRDHRDHRDHVRGRFTDGHPAVVGRVRFDIHREELRVGAPEIVRALLRDAVQRRGRCDELSFDRGHAPLRLDRAKLSGEPLARRQALLRAQLLGRGNLGLPHPKEHRPVDLGKLHAL